MSQISVVSEGSVRSFGSCLESLPLASGSLTQPTCLSLCLPPSLHYRDTRLLPVPRSLGTSCFFCLKYSDCKISHHTFPSPPQRGCTWLSLQSGPQVILKSINEFYFLYNFLYHYLRLSSSSFTPIFWCPSVKRPHHENYLAHSSNPST